MEPCKEDSLEVGPRGVSLAGRFQPHPSEVWAMRRHLLLSSTGLCVKGRCRHLPRLYQKGKFSTSQGVFQEEW